MKLTNKIIYILLFSIVASLGFAQKSNIAKIEISGVKNGSGIVIGQFNSTIYVATAHHVVEESNNKTINVSFNNFPTQRFKADSHYKKHAEADLVILKVEVPREVLEKLEFKTLKMIKPEEIKLLDKVHSIGYPLDKEKLYSSFNTIKENEDKSYKILLGDTQELAGGYSGGLVIKFDSDKVVGMNLTNSHVGGECLKMETIFDFAKYCKIETNYLTNSYLVMPKSSKVFMGLSLGAFTSAIVCRIQSNNKYRDYLAFGETLSPVDFEDRFGASLGEVYDRANGLNRKSIISTWAGSLFLTGATFFFIKENFWKDDGFSKVEIQPTIEDVLIDNSIGLNICLNF